MPAYRNFQTTPVAAGGLSPTWLLQPMGKSLEGALGDMKDGLTDRSKLAVFARLPALSPPDGLSSIGFERQILRGPTESDAAFSARLISAWSTWPYAATPFGLLLALFGLGYSNVYLMPVRGIYYTLNADQTGVIGTTEAGGSWTIDTNAVPALSPWQSSTSFSAGKLIFPNVANGYFYQCSVGGVSSSAPPTWPTTVGQSVTEASGPTWVCEGTDFWSRFDVIFSPVPASWNPTPPGATSDEINRIRLAIQQWKPAFATVNRIVALVSGKIYGYPASQVWGAGTGNWGSVSSTYYVP
jgi:hypothetical protein